ncbi:competence damage-inducible protein A [Secundilactobacillus oryzae JCM 18671]|uniref:Competence damage-inducible protein A n=1 Tax=Secundilactobacillus oryzae JCM 18671 TaxID=1291743 RepID=A0A081BIP4_9LACO|nr:nicotinamide-nucleotide amidohydrolase family protein [Secundilactobacillus oryzae]GAK47912.1 competence damage-inducible protein A [Secundilactobacillus oryzae JCM 18671]
MEATLLLQSDNVPIVARISQTLLDDGIGVVEQKADQFTTAIGILIYDGSAQTELLKSKLTTDTDTFLINDADGLLVYQTHNRYLFVVMSDRFNSDAFSELVNKVGISSSLNSEVSAPYRFRFMSIKQSIDAFSVTIRSALLKESGLQWQWRYLVTGEIQLTPVVIGITRSDFKALILEQETAFQTQLGADFIGYGSEEPLENFVVNRLIEQQKSITAAESLTAGEFQSTLGNVAGVSAVFAGGFVTYSNHVKHQLLAIPDEQITQFGVVSEEIAIQMANQAKQLMNTHFAVSFTGVAGPDALEGQPSGTVWVGIAEDEKPSYAIEAHFSGDRAVVRERSVYLGLDIVRRAINK